MERTILQTARGPVDVVVEGTGPAILYFHGTLSGSDLALARDRSLTEEGFQLIIPHRPGFYGTPLRRNSTTAYTADLAGLVLDQLGVDRVAVVGTSAGGLPAMAFSIRHAARTAALVLQCSQVHRWDGPEWAPTAHQWIYRWGRFTVTRWLIWQIHIRILRFSSPQQCLCNLSGPRFAEVQHDPIALQMAEAAYNELRRLRFHRLGYYNDLRAWTTEDVLATGKVKCPTLILHDPLDPIAPFKHAEYAAKVIEHSELLSLHAAGHLIWAGRDAQQMQQCRSEFLRRHLPQRAG